MSETRSALILFAHGSSDPAWAEPFHALRRKIATRRPELVVELAFLERMQPSLAAAVERLATTHRRIVVAPLFMGRGAHLRRDMVELLDEVRKSHAQIRIDVLAAAGEAEPVLDAISAWLCEQA